MVLVRDFFFARQFVQCTSVCRTKHDKCLIYISKGVSGRVCVCVNTYFVLGRIAKTDMNEIS